MKRDLLQFPRRRPVLVALQLAFLAAVLGFLGYALRDAWADAVPRLRDASLVDLGIGLAVLAAYYLLFVVGWRWILAALGVRVGYGAALESEMASMLAKYVPGGVWTPLARIVWLRRATGIDRTTVVLGSILLEAGLSAVAGVLVLVLGLAWVDGARVPLLPLGLFAVAVTLLVHPRVYRPVARRAFRRFEAAEPPVLAYPTMLALLLFYAVSWVVGGLALYFLIRSVGTDPGLATVPYLGGTAAVGAIVAVLSVIAPSGLGVREGSMYGLILAVAPQGAALGATVVNRVAITVVEVLLLALAAAAWRARARESREREPGWADVRLARRGP